jgi:ABC-type uncharacterized transport system ATPase subunit
MVWKSAWIKIYIEELFMEKKSFRNAYVVQATTHDFHQLLSFCEEILFVTTGYEVYENLQEHIEEVLQDFDPELDLLVPVGNVASNVLCGAALEKIKREKNCDTFYIAFYDGNNYITYNA